MYYTKEEEFELIGALQDWFYTESTFNPLFRILKPTTLEMEFNLFLDGEGNPADYGTAEHNFFTFMSDISFQDFDAKDELTFADLFMMNKQNLLARVIARVHNVVAHQAGVVYQDTEQEN